MRISSPSWALLLLLSSSGNALLSPLFLRPSAPSAFLGTALVVENPARYHDDEDESSTASPDFCCYRIRRSLTMRKQKASDRRTRRRQRGDDQQRQLEQQQQGTAATTTFTVSPMQGATWNHKQQRSVDAVSQGLLGQQQQQAKTAGGRGRSRKRTALYQTLAHYQNRFLQQLTAEYQAEVRDRGCRLAFCLIRGDPVPVSLLLYSYKPSFNTATVFTGRRSAWSHQGQFGRSAGARAVGILFSGHVR